MQDDTVTPRTAGDQRLRALMVRYQAGDLAAFDEIYGLIAPPIRRFLAARVRDAAMVDDLTQDTFLQMHRARRTYDPAYPLMPWAMAIARHVWLMRRRTASRRPNEVERVEDLSIAVRAEAAAYEAREAVRGALQAIPVTRRRAVVWHHLWGLSFRDIASREGIREAAAKLRSSRGIADLRALLGGGPPGTPSGRKTSDD